MKKKTGIILLVLLFVAGFTAGGQAASKPPQTIVFATHTVGTGAFVLVSLLAETIIEKTGIMVRSVPAGADVARTLMITKGEAHTAALNSLSGWILQEGLFEHSTIDWGPQPVRYAWIPQHVGAALTVRGDSNMHKLEDLRGKRVAAYPGSPSPHLMNEAFLAFAGLTWKDVIAVPFSGPAAGYDAVIKNRADMSFFNVEGGKAHELASMPGGARYIDVPESDTEGWKRARAVAPMLSPRLATYGANLSKDKPAWVQSQGFPNFICYDRLDKNIAYHITKYIHELYPEYSKKNESMRADWTIEKCLMLFTYDVVPMHAGSVQYFKEIGRWTAEHEKMNQDRIAHQLMLSKLWEQTVAEAKQKGITGKGLSELWMDKRAAAGLWSKKL